MPDRFLSYIFHELRTPLTVIHSYAQLSGEKLPPGPEFDNLRQNMNRMIGYSENVVEMIEEVLEASRIPLGRLNLDCAEIEASDLLSNTLERLSQEMQQSVTFSIPGVKAKIWADSVRLEKALGTLINFGLSRQKLRNLPPGLELKELPNKDRGKLGVSLKFPGVYLDTEELKDIFDLYRPVRKQNPALSKAGPLDIGLFIANGIIRAHEGTLGYQPEIPGFYLEIPLLESV